MCFFIFVFWTKIRAQNWVLDRAIPCGNNRELRIGVSLTPTFLEFAAQLPSSDCSCEKSLGVNYVHRG